MGNVNASEDSKRYRDGYPGKEDNPNIKANLEFYSNKRSSKPEGDTIEGIHKKWFGNYGLLEAHHGYIQWIFPIREDGLNHHAEQLQLHEAKAIANDPVLQGRIIKSYELMLDFYGMILTDKTKGTVERNPKNWKDRYAHLNRSFHNYLRITRILKCLGEVGLEHFKIHFVKHVLTEIFENRELLNCKESCIRYWAPVLRNEVDRTQCIEFIEKHSSSDNSNSNRNRNQLDSDEDSDQDDDDGSDEEKPKSNVNSNAAKDDDKKEEKKEEVNTAAVPGKIDNDDKKTVDDDSKKETSDDSKKEL